MPALNMAAKKEERAARTARWASKRRGCSSELATLAAVVGEEAAATAEVVDEASLVLRGTSTVTSEEAVCSMSACMSSTNVLGQSSTSRGCGRAYS